MTTLTLIILGLLIGMTASAPLGPIGIIVIQKTLYRGRWHGFISGLGASVADSLFAIVIAFSIASILGFIKEYLIIIYIFGSVFILFLGLFIFYTNPVKQIRKSSKQKNNALKDFISVFIITITNPGALFLIASIYTFFVSLFGYTDIIDTQKDSLFIIIGVLIGCSFWWFVFSGIISLFRKNIRLRKLWWINKITGAIIILLGILSIIKIISKLTIYN